MSEKENKIREEVQEQKEDETTTKVQEQKENGKKQRKKNLAKLLVGALVMVIFVVIVFKAGQKSVQEAANAKVAKLEQNLQKEYIDKKYALLEEQYQIFTLLKEGNEEFCFEKISWEKGKLHEMGEDALSRLVVDPILYLYGEVDDDVIEYIELFKEIVQKYPYSHEINERVIWRLESVESNFREEIKNVETFEAIENLKEQCEENIKLWEY